VIDKDRKQAADMRVCARRLAALGATLVVAGATSCRRPREPSSSPHCNSVVCRD
jgi:hypothetical protein